MFYPVAYSLQGANSLKFPPTFPTSGILLLAPHRLQNPSVILKKDGGGEMAEEN